MLALTLALLGSAMADSPQISTSVGPKEGVIVLWPRVIPATDDPGVLALAEKVQQRASELAARTFSGVERDVRPRPERVCPQAGCKATSFGSVLMHHGDGCAVAAWVAAPGRSPARPVPWSPGVVAKVATVKFREPVEGALTITDFQRCEDVLDSLKGGDAQVATELGAFMAKP